MENIVGKLSWIIMRWCLTFSSTLLVRVKLTQLFWRTSKHKTSLTRMLRAQLNSFLSFNYFQPFSYLCTVSHTILSKWLLTASGRGSCTFIRTYVVLLSFYHNFSSCGDMNYSWTHTRDTRALIWSGNPLEIRDALFRSVHPGQNNMARSLCYCNSVISDRIWCDISFIVHYKR